MSQSLVDRVCWLTLRDAAGLLFSSQSLVDRVCWLTSLSPLTTKQSVSIPGRPGVLADDFLASLPKGVLSQSLVDRVCWLTHQERHDYPPHVSIPGRPGVLADA